MEGLTRILPVSSPEPWMRAYRNILEDESPAGHLMQRLDRVAEVRSVWEKGATVFSAPSTTAPDSDWTQVSVAAKPWRNSLVASIWERIIRSSQALTEEDSATPVSETTLKYARQLLAELPPGLELPQPTVSTDGELAFTWFRGADRLDALLAPDHHFTWVFRIHGKILDGDVISFDKADLRHRFYEAVTTFYE